MFIENKCNYILNNSTRTKKNIFILIMFYIYILERTLLNKHNYKNELNIIYNVYVRITTLKYTSSTKLMYSFKYPSNKEIKSCRIKYEIVLCLKNVQ